MAPIVARRACPQSLAFSGPERDVDRRSAAGLNRRCASPGPASHSLDKAGQGLFDVTVTLASDQLESYSTRAVVEVDPRAHKFRICYAYDGRPPPALAKVNPRHEGAACLEIDPVRARQTLTGRYFTDRGTVGSLALTRRSTEIQN